MDPLLQFNGLTKTIIIPESKTLFAQASGTINEGDRIAVTGPSGQGKSTLLRILALLDEPDSGELFLKGKPKNRWEPRLWRMEVCYVSQFPVMLNGTVEDNLKTVSRLHQTAFDAAYASRLMAHVELGEMSWSKEASSLSGGEKQRIALVRSLLLRPKLLLLDEVTASLDEASKLAVEQLLRETNRSEGTGYVWISHDREQGKRIAERSWQLSGSELSEGAVTCL
ncbi:ABC transporter ATP-binding protein [Paenibacillus caui]|uniref:ABC transporter ATP-binding protein n=1 Tax=Paenibacillus caui TaxID=2873927 RepID=UPI001CA89E7D|nr:ATP-binding cassette domain-containing protein [Paenibacillus caui]